MSAPVHQCTEPSKCRSCQASILWVEWPSGKKMPVDAQPSPKGNIVLTHQQSQNKLRAEGFDQRRHEGRRRFLSHFSTCPHSKTHRRTP